MTRRRSDAERNVGVRETLMKTTKEFTMIARTKIVTTI